MKYEATADSRPQPHPPGVLPVDEPAAVAALDRADCRLAREHSPGQDRAHEPRVSHAGAGVAHSRRRAAGLARSGERRRRLSFIDSTHLFGRPAREAVIPSSLAGIVASPLVREETRNSCFGRTRDRSVLDSRMPVKQRRLKARIDELPHLRERRILGWGGRNRDDPTYSLNMRRRKT